MPRGSEKRKFRFDSMAYKLLIFLYFCGTVPILNRMNRREIVLAALAAGGENAAFSPVQVQKLFFLIDREASHLIGGPHFHFQPYDYGPFDQAVYQQLDLLEMGGLAETSSTGRYRRYTLTAPGFADGQHVLQSLPAATREFLVKTVAWVRSLSFQQLVAAIYNRYPDMKVNSVFRS